MLSNIQKKFLNLIETILVLCRCFQFSSLIHVLCGSKLTLTQTSPDFCVSAVKYFKNTARKGEIVRNEQFLLFSTVFSTLLENFPPFSSNSNLSSATSFSLEESKICRLGKGVTEFARLFQKQKLCYFNLIF